MSGVSHNEDVKTTDHIRGKGFVWCCVIAATFIIWMKVQAYFDGRALRFFSENSTAFIVVMGGMFLMAALFFWGLCAVAYFGLRHHRLSRVHFGGGVLLVLLMAVPLGDLYLAGVKHRLLPINQIDYISFASEVRRTLSGEDDSYVSLRSLDQLSEPEEKRRAEVFLKILERSAFEDWPREMLSVHVQPDSVSLSRGSGMLGRMGVEIFDLGPVPKLPTGEKLGKGSFATDEYELSSRVVFFRGD